MKLNCFLNMCKQWLLLGADFRLAALSPRSLLSFQSPAFPLCLNLCICG